MNEYKKVSPILKEALSTLESYKNQLKEAISCGRVFDINAGKEKVKRQTTYIKKYWPKELSNKKK